MNIQKKRATIAKGIIAVLRAEIKDNLIETKESDPGGYTELVKMYQEATETTRQPTISQLTNAEVEMTVEAGDAMRDYLDSFSAEVYDAATE